MVENLRRGGSRVLPLYEDRRIAQRQSHAALFEVTGSRQFGAGEGHVGRGDRRDESYSQQDRERKLPDRHGIERSM
jgi:hypothetical protein